MMASGTNYISKDAELAAASEVNLFLCDSLCQLGAHVQRALNAKEAEIRSQWNAQAEHTFREIGELRARLDEMKAVVALRDARIADAEALPLAIAAIKALTGQSDSGSVAPQVQTPAIKS